MQKRFAETKYISFLIKNVELLEKYNEISENVSNSIKKGFVSEPVYNEKEKSSLLTTYKFLLMILMKKTLI